MTNNPELRPPPRLASFWRIVPGIATGVFLSRIAGEWLGLPGWWAAVGLIAGLGAIGAWLFSRWPLAFTWPTLLLIGYIFYPEPSPTIAGQAGLMTLLVFVLNWQAQTKWSPDAKQPALLKPRSPLLVAGLLAAAFFLLYVLTIAPDVLAADSGEMQGVAAQLGVAHPPGFPLYILLAHLFTRMLPFLSPALAVNLLSAVFSALAVSVVYLTGMIITRRHLPSVLAAVILGTSTTFWSQATTANVRSLTGLFAALIIYSLLAFRQAHARGDRSSADFWLVATALFIGFGLTHHVSLIFLILIGLVFIVVADPTLLRNPRRWWRPVAAGLLGFIPLLYLPWRALAGVRGASPELATWSGFIEHVLATGFRGDLFYYTAPADFLQRLRIMANVMTFQFDIILLVAMIVGVVIAARHDRLQAVLLGATFALFTVVAATYRAPQTIEYMIPAYVAAALLASHAVNAAADYARRPGSIPVALWSISAALIIIACLNQLVTNRAASGALHEGTSAREYAGLLLAEAPPGSAILAHWHWATPLWYLQEVEGLRPDVKVSFIYPEGEPYDETWARRTQEAYAGGQPVITTWISDAPIEGLPIPEPIGEAQLYRQTPTLSLPAEYTEANTTVGGMVLVDGFRIEQSPSALVAGEELVLTIAWRPLEELDSYRLFVHLVGADGELYGQDDRTVSAAEGITLTQFRATPRPGLPDGPAAIFIGTDAGEGDRQLLRTIDVALAQRSPFTRHATARQLLDNNPTMLIGYDWDHSLADRSRLYLHWRREEGFFTQVVDDVQTLNLPSYRGAWGVTVDEWMFPRGSDGGHYVPLGQGIVWTGETVNGMVLSPTEEAVLDQEFHGSRAINRDYVVSVRLIGLEADGFHWDWWDLRDSIPAMGAIPTLKWIDGSFVRSPHRVTVAETAAPGQELTGALTLYDSFTRRTLPILDERMTAENPWIPLCRAVVE